VSLKALATVILLSLTSFCINSVAKEYAQRWLRIEAQFVAMGMPIVC
jgi:hypothetical protein